MSLVQERFTSNLKFRYQIIVSSIKFSYDSAILLTFIKLPFALFEWQFYTGFTVVTIKDTDLDTAAHATRASTVNNLTSYF